MNIAPIQTQEPEKGKRSTSQLKEKSGGGAGKSSQASFVQLKRQATADASQRVRQVAQLQKYSQSPPVQRKFQINDSPQLEQEADQMGAKALTVQRAVKETASGASTAGNGVVQRFGNPLTWLKRKIFGEGNQGQQAQHQQPLLHGHVMVGGQRMEEMEEEPNYGAIGDHTSSEMTDYASLAATGIGGVSTAVNKGVSGLAHVSLGVKKLSPEILGPTAAITAGVGTLGAVVDTYAKAKALGTTSAKEEGVREQQGDLASAASSIGTGIGSTTAGLGHTFGSTTAVSTGGYIAAPFAIAGGAADTYTGYKGYQSAKAGEAHLAPLATPDLGHERNQSQAVAHIAHESQKTKMITSAIKGGKGILGMIGGGLLLAGLGPVGWGILGAAGALAAGSAAYKYYKKAQLGKEAIAGQHEGVISGHDLDHHLDHSGFNYFEMIRNARAGDVVKGAAADKLTAGSHLAHREDILHGLGLKGTASGKEIAKNL